MHLWAHREAKVLNIYLPVSLRAIFSAGVHCLVYIVYYILLASTIATIMSCLHHQ